MISTDTFIEIGSQHKVCEDYIVSGDSPVPFVVLADGCSRSKDSEMGSRILCHLAKQYITYHGVKPDDEKYPENLGWWVIHNAEMVARQMGLKISCLDATLIVGYVLDNIFYAHMFGDGYILTQSKDNGSLLYEIQWVEYSKNAPYYLSYLIDRERAKKYHEMKISKHLHMVWAPYGEKNASSHPIECAYDLPITFKQSMDKYNTVLMCSDGVASFFGQIDRTNSKLVEVSDLLPELFGFKNTRGEFLKRRCNKYMKWLKKQDINHFDDLSVGAFLYEDDINGT